jgi:UDP-N-acetylglucosamine 2-epimerase (non-hydrolysing)
LHSTDSEKIYSEAKELLENIRLYQKMAKAVNPYGDGKAAERIVEHLAYYDASLAER